MEKDKQNHIGDTNEMVGAVDILFNKFLELFLFQEGISDELEEAYKQAKAMHKEEIINAVQSCGYIGGATDEEAEQYYNDTFLDESNN